VNTTDRRSFLKWLGGALIAAAAAGCTRSPTRSPLTPAVPSLGPTRAGWSWEIRWIGRTPKADPAQWRLTIDGLVDRSRVLTLDEFRALPSTTFHARMKCVECWSAPADWTGVTGRDVLSLVQAQPDGQFVTLHCLDGYTTTLSVQNLSAERVLFVYAMDGQDLPVEHGYPLRLLVPSKYGYKSAKAVERLEFVPELVPGYWETRGYDNEGTIQKGVDHPLDLGKAARPISGGEITEY
jgi:sulfoxide reductase catalytic subunit YedY